MASAKILIIDDDTQIRTVIRDRLAAHGYRILEAEDGHQGLELAYREHPDLMLLDLKMPGVDGMDVLKRLKQRQPETAVIILTAHGSIEQAVEAMRWGAVNFLPKPCSMDTVLLIVQKALDGSHLMQENSLLRHELEQQYEMIVGENSVMTGLMEMARKAAPSKTTILITGESGTGKQLFARAIHNMSERQSRPFIHVNCTTLSEALLESDLFGHEKGAFTGAVKEKRGRFELADKGTLFLDEIGELSLPLQAKLLHAIEYGEFQRVGGVETLRSDVRILAATNRDLEEEVHAGRFREDLFFRLNVMALRLPPLRERMDDFDRFVDFFLKKHNRSMQKQVSKLNARTVSILKAYCWKGNLRELDNVIERAMVLAQGEELTPDLLPPLTMTSDDSVSVGMKLEDAMAVVKKDFILKTLHAAGNNQTRAAKMLGIQRSYLNRILQEFRGGKTE